MQYINKNIRRQDGNAIVNKLLTDCWNADKYIGANYDGLCGDIRRDFINLLLDEQGSVCCYCMQTLINNHTTTFEHVVPHSCTIGHFGDYTNAFITDNVLHKKHFDYTTYIVPPVRYPHDIAYYNLIASCNSNAHCNHHRGNLKMNELIYDPNISNEVQYDRNGNAFCEKYFEDLATLAISTNSSLQLYRKLWALLESTHENLADITNESIDEVVYHLIAEDGDETVLNDFIGTPSKTEELMKFSWFFNYYKDNH